MRDAPISETYDIAVIGAGVGGLTAAALLTKAGFKVGVFEMDARPGGYLAGFRRKEFRFDSAIHWLNQCGPNGLVTRIFNVIGTDHPKAPVQSRIKRYLGDTYDYTLSSDPDKLKDQLIAEFPHEKKGILKFFSDAKQIGKSFDGSPKFARTLESMGLFEKLIFNMKRLRFVLPFIKHIRFTGPEKTLIGLKRYFKDPDLLKIFCSEEELLSALVPIGWAYYNDYQCPPEGGSQVFPEWLCHVIEKLDSEVHYKCKVTQIHLENGAATGLTMEQRGKEISVKCKHVVAASDLQTVYEKMLPPGTIPADLLQKLDSAQLYSSAVTISMGINCTVEELGLSDEMIFISREDVKRTDHNGGDPHKCGISVLAPSYRDSSLATKQKGTVTIYAYATFEQDEFWHTEVNEKGERIRGEAYKKFKNEFADVLIARVSEKIGHDLKSHIEYLDIATPITHWRYTGNRSGSLMGARPGKDNMQAGIAHITTPVKNLWLGGHWAELGGGVPIAVKAGMNASLLILKKEKPKTFKLLAGYIDQKYNLSETVGSDLLKPYDNSWKRGITPAEKATL